MSAIIPDDLPLSDTEQAHLNELRQAHRERIATHNVHDLTLIRYLRGYKDDAKPLDKSIEMLGKMLTWREEKHVDAIVATVLPRSAEFAQVWPSGVHGMGKTGHLVYVDRIGQVKPDALLGKDGFTPDEVEMFHIQMMERVNRIKEQQYAATGHTKYKHIVVLDLAGIGMGHLGSTFTGLFKTLVKIDQEFYSESLHQMVVCNAGFAVWSVWSVLSLFIGPRTRERIKFGAHHLPELIDAGQIPIYLGGRCKCAGGKCLVTPFVAGS
jgi:hypothetical protein